MYSGLNTKYVQRECIKWVYLDVRAPRNANCEGGRVKVRRKLRLALLPLHRRHYLHSRRPSPCLSSAPTTIGPGLCTIIAPLPLPAPNPFCPLNLNTRSPQPHSANLIQGHVESGEGKSGCVGDGVSWVSGCLWVVGNAECWAAGALWRIEKESRSRIRMRILGCLRLLPPPPAEGGRAVCSRERINTLLEIGR